MTSRFIVFVCSMTLLVSVASRNLHADDGAATELKDSPKTISEALVDPWRAEYKALARTAASSLKSDTPDVYAASLYRLESKLLKLMKLAAVEPQFTDLERERVLAELNSELGRLQWNYDSLQEKMRELFEAAHPGQSGARIVEHRVDAQGRTFDLYTPSYKSDKKLPEETRAAKFKELLAKHLKSNGKKPIYEKMDATTVKKIRSLELIELVVIPGKDGVEDEVRLTRDAKHAVTATGEDAMTAGSLKILWHPKKRGEAGEALGVYVSNWSGTYQPDMASLEATVIERLAQLGFQRSRIVFTPSMPFEPKIYEQLLQVRTLNKLNKIMAKAHSLNLLRLARKESKQVKALWKKGMAAANGAELLSNPIPESNWGKMLRHTKLNLLNRRRTSPGPKVTSTKTKARRISRK